MELAGEGTASGTAKKNTRYKIRVQQSQCKKDRKNAWDLLKAKGRA
jgi:hypothetical protein